MTIAELPDVPKLTSRPDIRYSEVDVELAYVQLRDDVAALREFLVELVDALRAAPTTTGGSQP